MTTVNVGQAKTELSRLIALALAGEEVEIARDGVPVVQLVPIHQSTPGARFLAAAGSLSGEIRTVNRSIACSSRRRWWSA